MLRALPHESLVLAAALTVLASCSGPEGGSHTATAAAPSAVAPSIATGVSTASAAVVTEASSAAPPVASAASSAPDPTANAMPTASAGSEAPLPDVEVKNIGMHIGGGPNDAETKAPIKRSVAPHFDSFRRCFSKVSDPTKAGDVSIDLHIQRAGGRAAVKKLKSMIEGEGFGDCVRGVFEAIDFEKPKTGETVVSYSLRFEPSKKR